MRGDEININNMIIQDIMIILYFFDKVQSKCGCSLRRDFSFCFLHIFSHFTPVKININSYKRLKSIMCALNNASMPILKWLYISSKAHLKLLKNTYSKVEVCQKRD